MKRRDPVLARNPKRFTYRAGDGDADRYAGAGARPRLSGCFRGPLAIDAEAGWTGGYEEYLAHDPRGIGEEIRPRTERPLGPDKSAMRTYSGSCRTKD
jgi:hypothetical protein